MTDWAHQLIHAASTIACSVIWYQVGKRSASSKPSEADKMFARCYSKLLETERFVDKNKGVIISSAHKFTVKDELFNLKIERVKETET